MDEDFMGNAVGSFSTNSKAVQGKKALQVIIDRYKDRFKFGLMTYRLPGGVVKRRIHNSPYFVSYNPRSYCPNPPSACVEYARTGNASDKESCETECRKYNSSFDVSYLDEILTNYPIDSEQRRRYSDLIFPKRQRMVNPSDPTRYIYFKNAYPFYSSNNEGTRYCYSVGYNPNEGTPWDSYKCYTFKTGTNDDANNYTGLAFSGQLLPTDSDYALGYLDFGRRLMWYYVGRTWFSNTSPGDGYLHVPIGYLTDNNGNPTSTYTNLMNKLDPMENDEAGYMSCGNADKNTCPYVVNAGLTPTAGTLQTAINYFKGTGYTSPIEDWCQKNFIVYVTDGLPSISENGTPGNADTLMPAVLSKLTALQNLTIKVRGKDYIFDIKTYILGVGLSDEAKSKLDEMALAGGTADENNGSAFYADNPQQLYDALTEIFQKILGQTYSFASPSVPSVRTEDGDIIYIAEFIPYDKSPFWPGNLKAYQLNPDGTLEVDAEGEPAESKLLWDAGKELTQKDHASRKIYTYTSGAMREFTFANITNADLGVTKDSDRADIINYVRGNVLDKYNIDNDECTDIPNPPPNNPYCEKPGYVEERPWKLGDIFHSTPAIVGSPSRYFIDEGYSGAGGFYETHKGRKRVIIVGANDGMLHAFNGGDWDETEKKYVNPTGEEIWAFIPPSLLKSLNSMRTKYTYYVDSSPKVADVWWGDLNSNGKKDANEWRTILVCGLRKGGKHYFALDITDNENPQFLWEFQTSGESWSEPAIGRVKIEQGGNLVEKWVAFIGGGFDPEEKKDKKANIGRAFYVIDITNGNKLWEFSYDKDDPKKKYMEFSLPAPPTAVDLNMDGYIDKVYIGDLGGQMWVFDVSFDPVNKKSDSLWYDKAYRLFITPNSPAEKHCIYHQAAVAFDKNRKPWVYFGTGDREEPKEWDNPAERFYAVRDDGYVASPLQESDLKNVTNINTFLPDPTKKGWFIILNKDGKSLEKVLSKPAVFNQLVYFTTYTNIETEDICSVEGIAKLYIVYYLTGGGALLVDDLSDLMPSATPSSRSKVIGAGAPSTPVITINRTGQGSVIIGTTEGKVYSQRAFSRDTNKNKSLLYWREVVR